MKPKFPIFTLLFLCLIGLMVFARIALGAPGDLRPFIELWWTPPATNLQVKAFRIYSTPDPAGTNWTLVTTLPPVATNFFVMPTNTAKFYALTSSNIWGESSFSAAVWTPPSLVGNEPFGVR